MPILPPDMVQLLRPFAQAFNARTWDWVQLLVVGAILAPAERGQVQGANELVVNLASAGSSLGSGVILAGFGYGALGRRARHSRCSRWRWSGGRGWGGRGSQRGKRKNDYRPFSSPCACLSISSSAARVSASPAGSAARSVASR